MSAATVSVVIPVHNGARYLEEAIASVLSQTFLPREVIVVDDGSTDDDANIAASFGEAVTVERIEHGGTGWARNRGIAMATGTFLAMLDADDRWTPNSLSIRLAPLIVDADIGIVWGKAVEFISPEISDAKRRPLFAPCPLKAELAGTMLVRRSVVDRVGLFPQDTVVGEFIDWTARARDLGTREVHLDDLVLERRLHDANTGLHPSARSDLVKTVHRILQRRRAQAS